MMRHKGTAVHVWAWERRRYWLRGKITDVEIWHDGRLLLQVPRKLPSRITDAEYCAVHRTHIYADLPCQYCGERPGDHAAVRTEDSAALSQKQHARHL